MDEDTVQANDKLDLNTILIGEFEYIAQTAFQANEDRARVSNYYFVTAAAAVAAIIGAKVEGSSTFGVYLGFSALFAVLSLVGLLTLLQLARLRAAWTESARAMNVIKQYYSDRFPELQPERAFAWNMSTIPPASNRRSVAFLLALSVILVDAVTAAAAAIYFSLAFGAAHSGIVWLLVGLAVGGIYALVQYNLYARWLK